MQLRNPAVVSTTVQADEVLAFVNRRSEREFILLPPREVSTMWTGTNHLPDTVDPRGPKGK